MASERRTAWEAPVGAYLGTIGCGGLIFHMKSPQHGTFAAQKGNGADPDDADEAAPCFDKENGVDLVIDFDSSREEVFRQLANLEG